MDIDDVLASTRPARREVPICLDGTLAGRLEALEGRWRDARDLDATRNAPPTAPAIAEQIQALQGEATAATRTFVVEALGATAWRRLVAEHPPVEEGWRWNLETFPLAAVAAATVDPKMSDDQAAQLADRLSDRQFQKLFDAVLAVNLGDDIPKFDSAIGALSTSEPNSTTAPHEESLTASSSASGASPDQAN